MLEIVELADRTSEAPSGSGRAAAAFGSPAAEQTDLYVIFTSPAETVAAVRVAADLARSLHGVVRLVDFRVVPVGAPVETPTGRSPLEMNGFLGQVRAEGIDARADVYVCRDLRCAIPRVFPNHSLIVLGGRHRWWPTRAGRLRHLLERRGHFVLMVDGA